MVVLVCLHNTLPHYPYYADVSKCNDPSVECVSKVKSNLSVVFHAIYGAVCIQLIPIDRMMIVIIRVPYLIIIIKSEV